MQILQAPSQEPTIEPSAEPTAKPSLRPTRAPSRKPSSRPSVRPSLLPSNVPSEAPTEAPSLLPSITPTRRPRLLFVVQFIVYDFIFILIVNFRAVRPLHVPRLFLLLFPLLFQLYPLIYQVQLPHKSLLSFPLWGLPISPPALLLQRVLLGLQRQSRVPWYPPWTDTLTFHPRYRPHLLSQVAWYISTSLTWFFSGADSILQHILFGFLHFFRWNYIVFREIWALQLQKHPVL